MNVIRIPEQQEHQKVRKQTLLNLLLKLGCMRNLPYSAANSLVQASSSRIFLYYPAWYRKHSKIWQWNKSGNDGQEIFWNSFLELHWNDRHLNTSWSLMKVPDQADSPWKADLTQSSVELVENLPLTLANTVSKAIIFHYKCG